MLLSTSSATGRGPSRLPMAYFAFSHLALISAFLCLAVFPQSAMGFFYHPWMMVPVHLVTLGWISASIFGALYMIAPMALRCRLREGRIDKVALWAHICGLGGMLAHFWIDSYGGMLWSACGVVFAMMVVGWRTLAASRGAKVALGVKLHLAFAFFNFLGVAILGGIMAFAKLGWGLLGAPLSNVYAHFHLAALGWVLMMIFGVAYRLLPMWLPAAMPRGLGPVLSALLLQVGTLGVFLSLLLDRPWLKASSWVVLGAVGTFAASLVWMLRHRKPRARGLEGLDFSLLHAAQAMLYLLLALGLGLSFVFLPGDEVDRLVWIPVYAILGLLGCAAQMIFGMAVRLFPLYAWLLALAEVDFEVPPASPHGFPQRGLQVAVFVLWTLGVPLLALAFLRQSTSLLVPSTLLLAAAGLASLIQFHHILRRAKTAPPHGVGERTNPGPMRGAIE